MTLTKHRDFSPSEKRRNVKKHLLNKGVKMQDMAQYLRDFLESYGHTGLETKTLTELLDKGSLFFTSLKKYTLKNGSNNRKTL